MCGIVGYIGNKEALPILIGGLKRLYIERTTPTILNSMKDSKCIVVLQEAIDLRGTVNRVEEWYKQIKEWGESYLQN